MRAIVLFEDQDRYAAKPIVENLEQATEALPDVTIEKVTYNYHIGSKRCINKWGVNQVWLLDLKSDKMAGPGYDPESQYEWCRELLDSDKDEFLSAVRRLRESSDLIDDIGDFAGLAVAVEASLNHIHFVYVSRYDQHADDLLGYIQWHEDYKNHDLGERCIRKASLIKGESSAIQSVLTFAFRAFSVFEITELDCYEWRKIRTVDEPIGRKLSKCPDTEVQKAIVDSKGAYRPNPFHPHHLKGGGDDSENPEGIYTVDIGKWASYVVSDDSVQILSRYGYDFQTGRDFQGPVTNWRRPPVRALIQDDASSKKNDFNEILERWAKELPPMTRVDPLITEISNQDGVVYSGEHMKHLWFNLPGVLHTLSTTGGVAGKGGWLSGQHLRMTFLLIGGKKSQFNPEFSPHPDDEMLNGFLGSIFAEGTGFNPEFPIEGKDSHRLCAALFNSGAKWVLYCDKDKKKESLWATLCTLGSGNQTCSHRAAVYGAVWPIASNPPLLSFFIPAVPHCSPFNQKIVPLVGEMNPIPLLDQNVASQLFGDALRYVRMLTEKGLFNETH